MITASDDKTIKIWAVNRQQFQASLIGHNNWVRTARFSPDTRMALSGGDDKVVKLWDLRTKQNMAEYYESTGQINAVRFHPSGNCVAAAGDDHSTRIWDIRTHKLLQHYSVSHNTHQVTCEIPEVRGATWNSSSHPSSLCLRSKDGPGQGTSQDDLSPRIPDKIRSCSSSKCYLFRYIQHQ